MNSTADRTDREQAIIADHEEKVMSGRAFRLVAASNRSIVGYQPPSSHRAYARALTILAKLAGRDDRMASLVAGIVPAVGLNTQGGDAVARIYDAAARTLDLGYFDTVGNASPEPGRRSDHEHAYTLADRLLLLHALAYVAVAYVPGLPSFGWCAAALAERERVHLPEYR